MSSQELRKLQVGTIAYLAVACVLIAAAPTPIVDPVWSSHIQVLAADEATVRALDRYLEARGVVVLSAQRATVEVQNFAGLEPVRLADLSERFDRLDPRLDPFLRAVDRLFVTESGDWHVLYVARDPEVGIHLRGALAEVGRDRVVVPSDPKRFAVLPAAFHLLALLPLLLAAGRRRAVVGAAGVLSLLLAGFWGTQLGVVALAVLAPWAFAATPRAVREQEWAIYGRWRGAAGLERFWNVLTIVVTCSAVALIVLGGTPRRVFGLVVYLFGLSALRVISRAAARRDASSVARRAILPRPILPRRAPEADLRRVLLPLVASGVALLAGQLVVAYIRPGAADTAASGLMVPTPIYLEAADALAGDPIAEPLSTAGYLAHRFFQQGIVYGADYRLPKLGEDLGIRRFRATDRGLAAFREQKLAIDASWMQHQLGNAVGGVYTLFTATDRPFVVRNDLLRPPARNDRIGAPASAIVLAGFALTALAVSVSLRGERRLGRVERSLRRSSFNS